MMKQKVFFFVPRTEDGDMSGSDDLRRMADDYVRLYGEGCLKDPETPSFVRQALGQGAECELLQAG
ncbi:MAG TPA: hypothetical protein PK919_08425 [Candidatus Aminicenantes bacterium]|nr:hypothetical protein [Candidatus Aminicenantes bacterium]